MRRFARPRPRYSEWATVPRERDRNNVAQLHQLHGLHGLEYRADHISEPDIVSDTAPVIGVLSGPVNMLYFRNPLHRNAIRQPAL